MKGASPKLADDARASIVSGALAEGARRARRRWIGTTLAIAAAAVLGLAVPAAMFAAGGGGTSRELAYGGPTDSVFDQPFEDTQRASERMDRIALARTHDYFTALRSQP